MTLPSDRTSTVAPRSRRRRVRGAAAVRLAALRQDLRNITRFGPSAPRRHELIWVRTTELDAMLAEPDRSALSSLSGEVRDGEWDRITVPAETAKITGAVRHWTEGVPWEATGLIDLAMEQIAEHGGAYDGCRTREDVERRYLLLDDAFEQVRTEGRLRPQGELDPSAFRESGGIIVHITRNGSAIWGRDGSHRIAMARSLGLEVIPAKVGVVHAGAVRGWRAGRPPSPPRLDAAGRVGNTTAGTAP
jgi:hypothetical protein